MRRGLCAALVAGGALAGCDALSLGDDLESQVEVTPSAVAPGGVVTLTVRTINHGDDVQNASNGCALGLGFVITTPRGDRVDPYGNMASMPCTLQHRDDQALAPGETDVVQWGWRTPALRGAYWVVGGLVRRDDEEPGRVKLHGASGPASFEVR